MQTPYATTSPSLVIGLGQLETGITRRVKRHAQDTTAKYRYVNGTRQVFWADVLGSLCSPSPSFVGEQDITISLE
jgi:hypothetical protein